MEVSAVTRNVRLSAQKGRPLAREVQGKPVSEALKIVAFSLIGRYSPMENGITGLGDFALFARRLCHVKVILTDGVNK